MGEEGKVFSQKEYIIRVKHLSQMSNAENRQLSDRLSMHFQYLLYALTIQTILLHLPARETSQTKTTSGEEGTFGAAHIRTTEASAATAAAGP